MKNILTLSFCLVGLAIGAQAQEMRDVHTDTQQWPQLQSAFETPELTKDQELIQKLTVEPSYEAPYGKLFDETAFLAGQTTYNDFVNVIVINKAAKGPTAQTLRLYTNRQLMAVVKVSTGKEDVEIVNPVQSFFRAFGKGSRQSHWRHTTRGFYTMKRIEGPDYKSGESAFMMPYAMFFNADRGLAIHQVPPDLSGGEIAGERMLGKRASGGGVRVHKNEILSIYYPVIEAGKGQVPVINSRTGEIEVDQFGRPKYVNGFRTIVIVEEY